MSEEIISSVVKAQRGLAALPDEIRNIVRKIRDNELYGKIPANVWNTEHAEEVAKEVAEAARHRLLEENERASLGAIRDYAGDQMSDAGVPSLVLKKVLRALRP